MKNTKIKALVIAPHHDDEVIGCGGAIIQLIKDGVDVSVIHVFEGSSGVAGNSHKKSIKIRNNEALIAAKIGGWRVLPSLKFEDRTQSDPVMITHKLLPIIRKVQPTIIFAPHDHEQDFEHQRVASASWEAIWLSGTDNFLKYGKPHNNTELFLQYEVWRPMKKVDLYLDISNDIQEKKKLISAYTSQVELTSWIIGSVGLASYRGAMLMGKGYVEAFKVKMLKPTQIKHLLTK
jgi:LmbE family N-acetylglucosaminyl deacetylase